MTEGTARVSFDQLLGELRPKLHRYCARMTGSVIDGEDVVQEALMKAIEAFPRRRSDRQSGGMAVPHRPQRGAGLSASPGPAECRTLRRGSGHDRRPDERHRATGIAAASLGTFMRLSVRAAVQRHPDGCARLFARRDRRHHGRNLPAVKAALHRGRARLREIARAARRSSAAASGESERSRLAAYVDRFNARDFDAVRDMLADEVRLDSSPARLNGKREVSTYFTNYSSRHDWHFVPGLVDGRPAAIVRDPTGAPADISCFSRGRRARSSHPRFPPRALRCRRRGADHHRLSRLRH